MSNAKILALTLGSAAVKIGVIVGVGYTAYRLLEKKVEVPTPDDEQ